jgi:RNA polymerase sigma-70 factor (ECF subfamily)
VECGDGHDHPRFIGDHPPGRQACGEEVRRGVARDRQRELVDIQLDQRDTHNLRIRDPGRVERDINAAKFVRAYEAADLDAVVALLTDDVFMSMPPMPFEYEGRDVVARFCVGIFGSGRRFDLVPTRANGQPAFGAYLRAPGGIRHATGLIVLTLTGDRICAMTRFENTVLPWFGLPRSLPSR